MYKYIRVVTIPQLNLSACFKKKSSIAIYLSINRENTGSATFHGQESMNHIIYIKNT